MNQVRRHGHARIVFPRGWLVGVVVAMLMAYISQATAAGVESRDFSIRVDNEPAGTYRMTITGRDNSTTVVSCQAKVVVQKVVVPKLVVYTYTYTYRGTETWQGNRLVRLDSATNDNGTQYTVNAMAEGNHLRVKVKGREYLSRWDVWTTSYWHLPDARFRGGSVPLLDADTGRYIDGQMRYVGTNPVTVAGQVLNCAHYRLTGQGIHVDFWYDAQERMVRQESIEDGHRTLLELTGLDH